MAEQEIEKKKKPRVDGQIIPRGNDSCLVRIYLGRNPQTGKREYHNATIKGEKEAKRYLRQKLHEIDMGTFVKPSKMTVSEYLDQWLQTAAKPRLRERTFADYEDLVRRYIKPAFGKKKLSNVRALDVQTLYGNMQTELWLSARTVRYTHAVLSSAFKQAVKWGMLAQNPASLVDLPKQERQEMQALSPDDAAKFLEAAADDRYGVLFLFALITGMRPGEYLGLQWKDLDLQKGVVTIQRTLVWRRRGGGWYFSEPKTSRSRRSIPIPFSLVQALIQHKRRQGEERLKAGPNYQKLDLVFATPEGGPLMVQNLFRRHFKPILKKAGLPESIRLYDLGHSCATLLLAENENPKVVSERLGHSTVMLTLDTYSHVLPSMQRAASDKLENILFGKTGTHLAHKQESANEKGHQPATLNSVDSEFELVARDGVEPPTRGFSVRCSTN
jgi:integrase